MADRVLDVKNLSIDIPLAEGMLHAVDGTDGGVLCWRLRQLQFDVLGIVVDVKQVVETQRRTEEEFTLERVAFGRAGDVRARDDVDVGVERLLVRETHCRQHKADAHTDHEVEENREH